MLLRDRQVEFVQKNIAALIQHGNTLGVAPTGCHAIGTPILMFDGHLKNVEDIEVGDILMGSDSNPRTVNNLCRGSDQMYEIRPIKGESFIVNSEHILSLQKTNEGIIGDHIYSAPAGTIINISVKDYLTTSANFKHLYKLYRTSINFNSTKPIDLDPYFLGVLIGDGGLSHGTPNITTSEHEIASMCQEKANDLGLDLRIEQTPHSESNTYFFATSQPRNILITKLKELKLYGKGSAEKFIPHSYKIASAENRGALLAGLLDTDGYQYKNIIEYSTASKTLAEDVAFVARSLGFLALPKEKKVNGTSYYRFYICGDLSILPLKVARKTPGVRRQKKNVLRTGFTVHPLNIDKYYGFTVDKDNLYMMGDFTVTHNSGKTICIAAVIGELVKCHADLKVCVLAHRDELTYQNAAKFSLVNPHITTSIVNSQTKSWDGQVTFAMVQTLSRDNNLSLMPKLDLLVVDEAHHITADSYRRILDKAAEMNGQLKVFGVTATPNRGDKTSLGEVFSNIGDQIKLGELISSGHLVRPKTWVINNGDTQDRLKALRARYNGDFNDQEVAAIFDTVPLNSKVVEHWKEKAGDRKTVVFCPTIEHARNITNAYIEAEVKAELLTCNASREEREAILNNLQNGQIQVIVNVAVLTEGWDFPPISCVVLLRSSSYKSTMIQMIGRGLRTIDPQIYPDIIKLDCVVLDFGISSILHGGLEQSIDLAINQNKVRKKYEYDNDNSDYDNEPAEAKSKRIIDNFTMAELDLLERSNFAWTYLRKATGAMITAGFNSWCCIVEQNGIWIAIGGGKKGNQAIDNIPTRVVYQGGKLEAIAAANDFLYCYETEETARKTASWRELPPTKLQISWLPRKYSNDNTMTRGDAAAILTYSYSAEGQLKRLGIRL